VPSDAGLALSLRLRRNGNHCERHEQSLSQSTTPGAEGNLSAPRWERFLIKYKESEENLGTTRNRHPVSALKKTRWIIHDRDKFERLVQEVAHFTAELEAASLS
jgi:hypothetical protein